MARTYVAEFNRELTTRQLDIHEGRSGLPPEKVEQYRALWRGEKVALSIPGSNGTTRPCLHRGDPTGEIIQCRSCSRAVPVPVFSCSVHGGCTIERPARSDTIACCKYCTDYINPNDPIPKQADQFVQSIPPYPEGKYEGRGITIAAGGPYWASAYVTVRMLRYVGCSLPIQIWYLGSKGERDERYERLLEPFGVGFVDIDQHPARVSRRTVKGFGTKLFAAVHSPFEEVLSLDPDNYPCADPTVLFDVPEYKKLGAIYWPDGKHTEKWTNWNLWRVDPRGGCGLETGQYVLNKRLVWEPMLLAEWYDDRPEWCYGTPQGAAGIVQKSTVTKGDYGDKGPPRAAFAYFKRDYVVFNSKVNWDRFAFIQPGPDGQTPMFVHRSMSKFTAEDVKFATTPQQGDNLRGGFPEEETAFQFLDELKSQLHRGGNGQENMDG